MQLIAKQDPQSVPTIRQMLNDLQDKPKRFHIIDVLLVHRAFLAVRCEASDRDQIIAEVAQTLGTAEGSKSEAATQCRTSQTRDFISSYYGPMLTDVPTGLRNVQNIRELITDLYFAGQHDDGLRWELNYLCECVENLGLKQYDATCSALQQVKAERASATDFEQVRMIHMKEQSLVPRTLHVSCGISIQVRRFKHLDILFFLEGILIVSLQLPSPLMGKGQSLVPGI